MSKADSEIVYIAELRGSLELNAEGVWIHNGMPFQNKKLSDLFHRSIIWDDRNSEYRIEIGNQRATFTCHDTAYFILSIDDNSDKWTLHISDGSTEILDPQTLEVGSNDSIYCIVHKKNRAKLLRPAHQTLADHVVSESSIQIGGKIHPLTKRIL